MKFHNKSWLASESFESLTTEWQYGLDGSPPYKLCFLSSPKTSHFSFYEVYKLTQNKI